MTPSENATYLFLTCPSDSPSQICPEQKKQQWIALEYVAFPGDSHQSKVAHGTQKCLSCCLAQVISASPLVSLYTIP